MPALGNIIINEPKNFFFHFFEDSVLKSPHELTKIEIYKQTTPTTSTLITTLYTSSGDIVEVPTSSGKFEYIVTLTTPGKYFEKIYVKPTPSTNFIKSVNFEVLPYDPKYSATLHTAPVQTCRIWGRILNANGTPMDKIPIVASILTFPNNLSGTDISYAQPEIITYTNSSGYFSLYLPRGINVFISIQDILFHKNILIPDLDEAMLFALAGNKEIGDSTNDITSGESIW